MHEKGWSSQIIKKMQIDAILIMCSMVRLGQTLLTSKARIDKDSFERITLWLRMLVDPTAADETRKALLHGKYLSEGAAREWSTVVDISIKPPSFKLVTLPSPRFLPSKTPKHVIF